MSEQSLNGAAVVEEVIQKKKRGGGRRKSTEGESTPPQASRRKPAVAASVQVVTLTSAQVCNLWRAVMGGELVIERDAAGAIVCRVSFESFEKALPVLLDQLK